MSVMAQSRHALADIEAEDTAVVIVNFKNGALGVIEATTATRPKDLEGSLSILGSEGTVVIGGFAVNQLTVWEFETPQESDRDVMAQYSVNPPTVYGFGHQAYYQHVVSCLTDGVKPLVDGQEGRRSLELINAIYTSIETKREVLLSEAGSSRLGHA